MTKEIIVDARSAKQRSEDVKTQLDRIERKLFTISEQLEHVNLKLVAEDKTDHYERDHKLELILGRLLMDCPWDCLTTVSGMIQLFKNELAMAGYVIVPIKEYR